MFEKTIFFTISDDVATFRKQLTQVIPLITTTTQAQNTRATIVKNKQTAAAKGIKPSVVPVVGVTLGFSRTGVTKVCLPSIPN